jgi:hypothetical protein
MHDESQTDTLYIAKWPNRPRITRLFEDWLLVTHCWSVRLHVDHHSPSHTYTLSYLFGMVEFEFGLFNSRTNITTVDVDVAETLFHLCNGGSAIDQIACHRLQ